MIDQPEFESKITPMRIMLANPRGFCAGVHMAIDVVEQVLDIVDDEVIYVYHDIVHNRHVVDDFRKRSVRFIEDVNEAPPGSIIVFSAHGVSPAVREQAAKRNLQTIDATCPLVTKVHAEAIRYARHGYQILLIGHREHQEIKGTLGEAPQAMQVVESPDDIANLTIHDPDKLVYLTQTTLSIEDAERIIHALREAFPNIKDPPSEDICYATTNRQQAIKQLAPQTDLVLVIGSQHSSNSQRLRELAESSGAAAHLVDDKSELDPKWFADIHSVLITAGASAPEHLVKDLILHLIEHHGGYVEQHDVFHESVEFGLPGTLKQFMRKRDVNPEGRKITMDNAAEIDRWLTQNGIAHETIDLTISAGSN